MKAKRSLLFMLHEAASGPGLFMLLMMPGLGILFLVDGLSPAPTNRLIAERCTRYCHDHPCPHFAERAVGLRSIPGFNGMRYGWGEAAFAAGHTEGDHGNLCCGIGFLPGCRRPCTRGLLLVELGSVLIHQFARKIIRAFEPVKAGSR